MAGMDDHIAKPIDPRTLLTKISRWASAGEDARSDQANTDQPSLLNHTG
jgi:CheY-like chemotaxis protein